MWTNLISIGLVMSVCVHGAGRVTVKAKDVSVLRAMKVGSLQK